ncbi:Hypothetical protein SMAX5B_018785 [Scophthalmus maximus]|uniref:Uncharacterized protein n=1 Tax=Scophthalmus maximus TaxID=52904 RepID=A0A2U9BQU8_SCOMX|nr:Hypothetical protein SMAX5B_018785 [Scophthalmus maximus]
MNVARRRCQRIHQYRALCAIEPWPRSCCVSLYLCRGARLALPPRFSKFAKIIPRQRDHTAHHHGSPQAAPRHENDVDRSAPVWKSEPKQLSCSHSQPRLTMSAELFDSAAGRRWLLLHG